MFFLGLAFGFDVLSKSKLPTDLVHLCDDDAKGVFVSCCSWVKDVANLVQIYLEAALFRAVLTARPSANCSESLGVLLGVWRFFAEPVPFLGQELVHERELLVV
ncbi:hypothetical protein SZ60_06495 [Frigoribacterium sp. MEB024]|nr:hypothetical protein [Frigoribacterium sp. MEB024]KIU03291.1 hypothetical protein SZ60_06495 [Frigoribacterium sp. MEB024]